VKKQQLPSIKLVAFTSFLIAFVFILDLNLPLGVAGGVPYVFVVITGWWYPDRKYITLLGCISSLLTILGYYLSSSAGVSEWIVIINRFYALLVIFATTVMLNLIQDFLLALKENKLEVLENERRLAQFLEAMPVGVGVLDANGKPYYVNQKAEKILGKGVIKEANTSNLSEIYQVYIAGTDQLYPSKNLPVVRALRGESTSVDNIEIRRGGKIIPLENWGTPIFDNNGNIIYAINAFKDIAKRKQAEAAREQVTRELSLLNATLEQQMDELVYIKRQRELILKAAGEGIYGLDVEGLVTFVNPAAVRMLGWESEELVGQHLHSLIHHSRPDGSNYPAHECPIYMAFKDGVVHHMDEEVFWCKSGISIPVEYTSTPIYENDKLVGAVVVLNDISERKHAEAAREQVTQELSLLNATLEQKVQERTAQLKQKNELIRKVFGRYLSDEIVDTLLETKSGLSFGGEKREITLLTSDIRGFTAKINDLPPEQVIKIINCYLTVMADVITQYQGTIDEFMGDGILVLFGAPIARNDDPERAVACAIAMQLAMESVNEQLQALNFGPSEIGMGIGINTGEVVVGNLGSEKRAKYGVIGSEVNVTYRIESYTTENQILISESTLKKVSYLVTIISEKMVKFKGLKQDLNIYEVAGLDGKYDLHLHKEEEVFMPLWEEIPLRYAVVEGKQVSDKQYLGRLVKLSAKSALISCDVETDCLPKPLTNLKLNLVGLYHSATCEDLYAKVLSQGIDENSLYIRFTSSIPNNTKEQLMVKIRLEWTPDLSVHPLLDEQHQQLFLTFNELITFIGYGKLENVAKIISFLETYVITHFDTEENLMKQHSYPNYKLHKAQHAKFIENLNDFKKKYQQNQEGHLYLALTIRNKLVDWFIHHIGSLDKQLGIFLIKQAL